jgi:hypothetical protein
MEVTERTPESLDNHIAEERFNIVSITTGGEDNGKNGPDIHPRIAIPSRVTR